MFTGIIEQTATVETLAESPRAKSVAITSSYTDLKEGESIAVNGVCLTVTKFQGGTFYVDISPETLAITSLGSLRKGSLVNLERALTLSTRLGGHMVTGHVDQTGTLESKTQVGEYVQMRFSGIREDFKKFLHKKGSIAINGVSLTVNEWDKETGIVEVMLIPHTLQMTNLSSLLEMNQVNFEFDWMSKVIISRLESIMQERNA